MTAPLSPRKAVGLIVTSVIVGAPLVYLAWEEINELLTGRVVASHLAVAVGAALLLALVLRVVATVIRPAPRPEDL
jgi:hypothetical protein